MSKGLAYFLGILTGVVLTIGGLAIAGSVINKGDDQNTTSNSKAKLPDGVTMLDEPVPFTEARNFEIMQVVFTDGALAQSEQKRTYSSTPYYSDPIVLLLSDTDNAFYDDQIVKAPKDSKVMQVGTYKYETKIGWKTVPIIKFITQ